jgi:hypothetical protein
MLQSYRKNRKESNHGINLEKKTHQFVGKTSKNDCRYYKCIKKTKNVTLYNGLIAIPEL